MGCAGKGHTLFDDVLATTLTTALDLRIEPIISLGPMDVAAVPKTHTPMYTHTNIIPTGISRRDSAHQTQAYTVQSTNFHFEKNERSSLLHRESEGVGSPNAGKPISSQNR